MLRLALNIIGISAMFWIAGPKDRTPPDPEMYWILAAIIFGGALAFALTYFLAGWWDHHKSKYLFDVVTDAGLLDGNAYRPGMAHTGMTLFYSQQYLAAAIAGFPVRIYLNGSYGEPGSSTLRFDCCIMKFGRPHTETCDIPLNWRGNPKKEVGATVSAFIQALKAKEYAACSNDSFFSKEA